MTNFERQKIDLELKAFTTRNFNKPSECSNLDQIRFYVRELCMKIEDLETRFDYAPQWAYTLLAQYNARQNSILHMDFKNAYC